MPTDLTGSKIKDSYGQLLHVDGGVTSTLKTVYDGDGTATGLKVSTTGIDPGAMSIELGTANGVAYLNGSKVLTTGSALTFDGSSIQASSNVISGRSGGDDGNFVLKRASDGLSVGNLTVDSANSLLNLGTAYSYLTFSNYLGEQMRLTSTGLGIGTSSPAYKLDVSGNARATGYILSTANSGSGYISPQSSSACNIGTDNGKLQLVAGTVGVAATIDTSGNLGLGVTPSASWASSSTTSFSYGLLGSLAGRKAGQGVYLSSNVAFNGDPGPSAANGVYLYSDTAAAYSQHGTTHKWFIAPSGTAGNAISFTQAMTLDSSGNLLVGATSTIYGIAGNIQSFGSSNFVAGGNSGSGTCTALRTINNNSGATVGTITYGASSTAYNTSSDYRLKENIQPMQNALAVIQQLNPVTYNWKADGSDGQGFIAHELQAVVPDCVTGEKDAVDDEGNPVYQGIDTSFLVGILTKAIQELKAELDATKAEIAALKGV